MTVPASVSLLNLIVADAQPIFTTGLKSILSRANGRYQFSINGVARTGMQLDELMRSAKVDLVIIELFLPDTDGVKMIASIKKSNPNVRVLVVTSEEDPRMVKAAFRGGTDGYILKTANESELLTAIESVTDGKTYLGEGVELLERVRGGNVGENSSENRFAKNYGLTRREMEVMRYIGQALNNKEISEKLFISDQTVSVHRKNIMRKLGVNNTASLIKIAFEHNIVGY